MAPAFVPDRLVSLIGRDARELSSDSLKALAGLPESDVLDFKRMPIWKNDDGKTKLATHIAAFANRSGGLIVVGVEEAPGSAPATLTPIADLDTDKEELQIRQAIHSRCFPLPEFDVVDVEGLYLVISIPPSPRRPHAVIKQKDGHWWPLRHGAGNRYLSESEVADLYRNRFTDAADQLAILDERHNAFVADQLPRGQKAWLTVATQPTRRGSGRLTRAQALELTNQVRERIGSFPGMWGTPQRIQVRGGYRHYRFHDGLAQEPYLRLGRLNIDGGGAVAHGWSFRGHDPMATPETVDSRTVLVGDEEIVAALINSLALLASWAVDDCAAGGDGLVVAQLHPADTGATLWQMRSSFPGRLHDTVDLTAPSARVEMTVSLSDLASDSRDLLRVVRTLAQDLGSAAFEQVEPNQIDTDGRLRISYFNRHAQPQIRQWASANEVEVTEESVPT